MGLELSLWSLLSVAVVIAYGEPATHIIARLKDPRNAEINGVVASAWLARSGGSVADGQAQWRHHSRRRDGRNDGAAVPAMTVLVVLTATLDGCACAAAVAGNTAAQRRRVRRVVGGCGGDGAVVVPATVPVAVTAAVDA